MAHFIGRVQGSRGEASRLGGKDNGMTTKAAGWKGCIRVDLSHRDGQDRFTVVLTPWGGSGGAERVLAEGVLDATITNSEG